MIECLSKVAEVGQNTSDVKSTFDPDAKIAKREVAPSSEAKSTFNPDAKIEKKEVSSNQESENSEKEYNPEEKVESSKLYTTYKERIDKTPNSKGDWTGERGESKYIPADIPENEGIIGLLKSKGIDGIEYKNGIPDFSPVSEGTVKIQDMTDVRSGKRDDGKTNNFGQACEALAEKWNADGKDGRKDWDWQDVVEWSKGRFTIHECTDLQTCHFIDVKLHDFFKHAGGVAEYKAKSQNSE